ncbi:unnamed protein product [Protopolystoma xenopodis]|uniref:Uncharacterized protein n=1 Tax=Protopolystoma xenopodis TaxID=117903 RepID=A0A448XGA9_9PLAT|nr:unnamed protein product [Protopolystoma xenopodis]
MCVAPPHSCIYDGTCRLDFLVKRTAFSQRLISKQSLQTNFSLSPHRLWDYNFSVETLRPPKGRLKINLTRRRPGYAASHSLPPPRWLHNPNKRFR